ncbi:MAG: deoxyribonuclease IV [Deltaproteobacteria bacterium]|nr:MAG: deoxyribonuclease IV [Deltaproteobacteria bacterium]
MKGPAIGAHVSVAGGISRAFANGEDAGCDVVQIFARFPTRWVTPPLSGKEVDAFFREREKSPVRVVATHASYLINVASEDERLRERSIESLRDELRRAETLEIGNVVLHPGSSGNSSVDEALTRVALSVRSALEGVKGVTLCLEVTAGQGNSLGYRLSHLREIIDRAGGDERLAVCLDTCHLFAAGYDIATKKGFDSFLRELDELGLLPLVRVIHVNDSKREMGSRVDRHEHILEGQIGRRGFANFLKSEMFQGVPFIIETPKGDSPAESDRRNIEKLRRIARR